MSVITSDSDMDLTKLKVADLKQELKKRGLSTDGKKHELVERLQTSIGDAALLDDSQDDLLDDAELSDEEVLDDSAIDMISQPEPIKSPIKKRPIEEDEKKQPKKIILNRKTIDAVDPVPATATPEAPAKPTKGVEVDKPKLHVLTEKERQERRAARFGVNQKVDSAVVEPVKSTQGAKLGTTPVTGANIDLLKKRAERFGTIAPVLEKVKMDEKKMERLKRFGEAQLKTTTAILPDEKKAQRAARFAS